MALTPINDILSRSTRGEPEPVAGMGATILLHSDRHACTIVEVQRDKNGTIRICVQRDTSKVTSGSAHDGSADYTYTPNPKGAKEWYQRKPVDVRWREVHFNEATNRWKFDSGSHGLRLGEREEYYDPSF